ncbi:MAG TPA: DUF4038 domain-containing protein [Verrucomicrobiae bacterium]|nr:DUF4038 domain-containing protein [Verrucomicrobiae bacterium]
MANLKSLPILLTAHCLAVFAASTAWAAPEMTSVPKWQRFELTLKSSRNYANPLHDAEVRVLFVSPLGETNRVYGFWDGSKTWRVRYQPAFPGRWTYYTMCSDTSNSGLHNQKGEFLCIAAKADHRFAEHGPLQVARDHQHFEHADRTPFLWLGDAAWNAAERSLPKDWNEYVRTRASQKFNVVQWRMPATVFKGRSPVEIKLESIRQLETKIESANQAGLLNAIAPLWEIGTNTEDVLPEDQAIILLRHCVARWDSANVAWIIAFEADSTGTPAARWQRIGRAVFNTVSHSPVVILPGEATWVLDHFRQERWVDALGLQTTQVKNEDSLPWLLNGPLALERNKTPARPLITLSPAPETENSPPATSGLSRRLLWWNLLLNTPAGVSCSAADVADWTTQGRSPLTAQPWYHATSLACATAIAPISDCFTARDFWRLQPLPHSVIRQPEIKIPRNQIVATSTELGDLIVAYVPEDRSVGIASRLLPARAGGIWFNPRTGETSPAIAVNAGATFNFATPSPGDWLLILTAKK